MSEFTDEAKKDEVVDDEVAAMFDLSKLKKKKKKVKKADEEDGAAAEGDGSAAAGADGASGAGDKDGDSQPPKYIYDDLLNRVYDLLHANDPDRQNKAAFHPPTPKLMRVGTKKTVWTNFNDVCLAMHRSMEHVFQFMMAELGTEGSIDASNRVVIKGKFIPRYIESLLRKYISTYVICQMCRSFDTKLKRDPTSRLHFVECVPNGDGEAEGEHTHTAGGCGSSRSVAQIRAGYHAQTRADRRAARNA
jgi:translation initiation factor 2 subunit 2